jgi:hypothetical protein
VGNRLIDKSKGLLDGQSQVHPLISAKHGGPDPLPGGIPLQRQADDLAFGVPARDARQGDNQAAFLKSGLLDGGEAAVEVNVSPTWVMLSGRTVLTHRSFALFDRLRLDGVQAAEDAQSHSAAETETGRRSKGEFPKRRMIFERR